MNIIWEFILHATSQMPIGLTPVFLPKPMTREAFHTCTP